MGPKPAMNSTLAFSSPCIASPLFATKAVPVAAKPAMNCLRVIRPKIGFSAQLRLEQIGHEQSAFCGSQQSGGRFMRKTAYFSCHMRLVAIACAGGKIYQASVVLTGDPEQTLETKYRVKRLGAVANRHREPSLQ